MTVHSAHAEGAGAELSALDAPFIRALDQLAVRRPLYTTQAIFSQRGTKLIDARVRLDTALCARLLQHRLALPVEASVAAGSPLRGADLRVAADACLQRVAALQRHVTGHRIRRALLDAIEAVPLPAPIALHLTIARELRPALFRHGVATALFAAVLGLEQDAGPQDLTMLAAAGLLHDLGMLHIDPGLLEPGRRLQGAERRLLHAHPLTSSLLIQPHHAYSPAVVRAALEHHERLDGSGYPRRLCGAAIGPWGRILGLAQTVAALLDGTRSHPELRLSLLLRLDRERYDARLTRIIQSLLQPDAADAASAVAELGDPIAWLLDLHDLLEAWPGVLAPDGASRSPSQHEVFQDGAEQLTTLRRRFVSAGVDRGQLASLRSDGDESLGVELSLIAQELAWQLRGISEHIAQCCATATPGDLPAGMRAWIDRSERLTADVLRAVVNAPALHEQSLSALLRN